MPDPGLPLTTGEGNTSDLDAISRRWHTAHDRGAHDYTDAGCRVLAEHGFADVAALLAECSRLREQLDAAEQREERIVILADERYLARYEQYLHAERQAAIEEARADALTAVLAQIVAEAERWNDGEFALWRKDDLVNALVRLRAVLAAATSDTPPKDSGGALGQTPPETRGGDS